MNTVVTVGMTFIIFLVLRIVFYPYTIEEKIYDLDEDDVITEGDCIRFTVDGCMLIRSLKDRMLLKGYNYQGKRFVKFRTCGLLYNKETYRVVLISVPFEEYKSQIKTAISH